VKSEAGPLRDTGEGLVLEVWIQPRASRDGIAGVQGGALKIRVAAPPVDGEANDALVRFIAKLLGVPRASVEIVRGHSSRTKALFLRGVGLAEAARALQL
jgi:uncharacterized protein (TIGR00251 family)